MKRVLWGALTALLTTSVAGPSRAETISLRFVLSSPFNYIVSYLSTGAGPAGGAVDFDANHGTAYSFNPTLIGVNIDSTFSITYTSVSGSDDWLGARHNEGFLTLGLTAGPLTLGTLTVSVPLVNHALVPMGNDPTAGIHRLGESNFGDTYRYSVVPEPTTAVLLGAALAGIALLRRRVAREGKTCARRGVARKLLVGMAMCAVMLPSLPSRAAPISLTFLYQTPSTYLVWYSSTGAGPIAVDFDANYGTAYSFNPALFGVHIDTTFSITYTSVSGSDNWLGARHSDGFLPIGLTAGPLTLGTLTVSTPLVPVTNVPIDNNPLKQIHRLGESNFGDTYTYSVIVPEPATGVLLALGLTGLAWLRRRRSSS